MFNDKEIRFSINWKDLIIKIVLLVLLIVLLIWLIPNPQIDTFYDRIFNDNIQTMKEAAKSYYTVDKLPAKIGESSTMTLEDMIKNHMILEFVDKDNKVCDGTESYVQVTKTSDNEYVLKVQLKCGDTIDYILDTIGCHDVCPDGNCKEEEPTTITKYEFKKEVPTTTTTYTCPAGYTRKGTLCYKNGTTETIKATVNYFDDTILAVNAKVNSTGSYVVYADPVKKDNIVCPNGYTSNGVQCVKTYKASGSMVSGTYTCPDGYTLSGATCYKTYSATYTNGSVSYTCPEGYTLKDTACYKTVDAKLVKGKTGYTCPSGYDLQGTNCVKVVGTPTSGSTSYTCDSGDRLDGSTCYKTWTTDATANKVYGNWYVANTYSTTTPKQVYSNDTEKLVDDGMVYKYTCDTVSKCPVPAAHYNYILYKRNVTTNYTCSSGSLSGNKCVHSSTYGATASSSSSYCATGTLSNGKCIETTAAKKTTAKDQYTCSSGTLSGNKCILVTASTRHTDNGKYTCPEGGVLNGTLCRLSKSATTSGGSVTLSCPYGGSLSGNDCISYTNGTMSASYTCPTGYTASGSGASTTCSKTVTGSNTYYCENKDAELKGTKCYYKVKGTVSGYTCPTGYTKNGSVCTKTNVITVKATAKTTTTKTFKYTWSEKEKLDGWVATGKKETFTK